MDFVVRHSVSILAFTFFAVLWITAAGNNTTIYDRRLLDKWCPRVDICDENATFPNVKRNGKLKDTDFISCCSGCSCHPRCKETLNCCFPDKQVQHGIMNVEHEQKHSKNRCLPTSLGTGKYPMSYVTIVTPPEDGCINTKPVRLHQNTLLYPTCDDRDITPWGPYYPAYSRSAGEVFKNVLCTLCHGVTDSKMFTPQLVCKGFDTSSGDVPSMSQQVLVFKTGKISKNCHIEFNYSDLYEISNWRCFQETISTCDISLLTPNEISNKINMTVEELKRYCNTGLYSPIEKGRIVYKNVFCYLCNYQILPTCRLGEQPRAPIDSFTHMIDPELVLSHENRIAKKKHHQLCLKSSLLQGVKDKCREVYCPSGKIRNKDGDCILVSQRWGPGGIFVIVKLTPIDEGGFFRTVQDSGHIELKQTILASSPWSTDWNIFTALRREDTADCTEKAEFVLQMLLTTTIKIPSQVYLSVREAMSKPWIFRINGQNMTFNQSFLEYNLGTTTTQGKVSQLDVEYLKIKYLPCEKINWKKIFTRNFVQFFPIGAITKLFFCDQIQLEREEFVLVASKSLLVSNLTKEVLHTFEFEEIVDGEESYIRVCAEDTFFEQPDSNRAGVLSATKAFYPLILVALFIDLSPSMVTH